MEHKIRHVMIWMIVAGVLACGTGPVVIGHAGDDKGSDKSHNEQVVKGPEGEAKSQADEAINQKRKEIIDEAAAAVTETRNAVSALEKKDTKEALANLERATGKLNIVLARDPKLALAPVDVQVVVHELDIPVDEIKESRKKAEDLLEDGEVQKARRLLHDLGSEIVMSVVSLPLKTYPAAIAAATPLIDQGKTEEAKQALEAALSTLVVTDHIISLPLLRADEALKKAETLAQKEGRSEEENMTLTEQLNEARAQLKLAEALGYGTKKDHKALYAEIDQIEKKTKGGKFGKGFFTNVKEQLSKLSRSIFG